MYIKNVQKELKKLAASYTNSYCLKTIVRKYTIGSYV